MKLESLDIVLFDFDGTLVDSEKYHYMAYKQILESYGKKLDWSFAKYGSFAHTSSTLLRKNLMKEFADLFEKVSWETFYQQKKKMHATLLEEQTVDMMPGAPTLLKSIQQYPHLKQNVFVVTQSPMIAIEALLPKMEELRQTIAHWITQGQYKNLKPHPEPYLIAIKKAVEQIQEQDKEKKTLIAIGFEDTPRGLISLKEAFHQWNQDSPIKIQNHLYLLNPFSYEKELQKAGDDEEIQSLLSNMETLTTPLDKYQTIVKIENLLDSVQ